MPSMDGRASWSSENLQVVVTDLFEKHDKHGTGLLSWKSGEVIQFLDDFFRMQNFPPPRLPTVVFSTLYNQVKQDSGSADVQGLNVEEMCDFTDRVHGFINKSLRGEMRQQ